MSTAGWATHPTLPGVEVSPEGYVRQNGRWLRASARGALGTAARAKSASAREACVQALRVRLKNEDGRQTIRSVHVLVLEAWRGERPAKHYARHRNGVVTDNRLSNLEWATYDTRRTA